MKLTDTIAFVSIALALASASAESAKGADGKLPNADSTAKSFRKTQAYSPYAGWNYPMRVYWGDTHLHTAWSADAGAFGATVGPEEALRFARGEEVVSSTGQPVKLAQPLDFLIVTDHSDGMGVIQEIRAANPELMADPTLKRWHDMMEEGPEEGVKAASEMIRLQSTKKLPAAIMDPKFARSIWERNTAIMERYNDPGRFTAFIGYEWTSNAGGGDNLHRNVIYRDGKDKADQVVPLTTFDSENPEDLWKWMEAWEKTTGGSLLAIPHNGNLSNGRMFQLSTFLGNPLTREWAATRARWEPLYETGQIKGVGETHPILSPNDEFAGYEIWDKGNLNLVPKKPGMLQYEYSRRALQNGLKLEQELGINPFKFGLICSTDSHTGLTTAEEDNFFGKHSGVEPGPDRWKHVVIKFGDAEVVGWEMAAAGWAGVWATDNSREALWDAMKRKEVYGTTGPRMAVRFFGGWDFDAADAETGDLAEPGYTKGVPMGADLPTGHAGRSPTFLVGAQRDPLGANLDRYQIVKGWVDEQGELQEKVYDVAWSGNRSVGADGKVPPIGDTVDVAKATWTNAIGSSGLVAVWRDPDFDPSRRAFYYGRVLQIPTPRWTAYDAERFGTKMSDKVPMTTQDRAYTSPIWYTPAS